MNSWKKKNLMKCLRECKFCVLNHNFLINSNRQNMSLSYYWFLIGVYWCICYLCFRFLYMKKLLFQNTTKQMLVVLVILSRDILLEHSTKLCHLLKPKVQCVSKNVYINKRTGYHWRFFCPTTLRKRLFRSLNAVFFCYTLLLQPIFYIS